MSSEIKDTIGLLCKLLNLLYKTNLKSEHFRLAKFDKIDENVVAILWASLNKICVPYSTHIKDIKILMNNQNYKRKKFYDLSEQQEKGSRELLFAMGFLLSTNLERKVLQETEVSAFSESYEMFGGNLLFNEQQSIQRSNTDYQHYKKWLCGKICSNKNMMEEYKEQICKMHKKLNKNLNIKANVYLTTYEILALKNKRYGERFHQDSKHILEILFLYTEWIKKEKIFWKWMTSILDEEKLYTMKNVN